MARHLPNSVLYDLPAAVSVPGCDRKNPASFISSTLSVAARAASRDPVFFA